MTKMLELEPVAPVKALQPAPLARILCIDDDPGIGRLVKNHLDRQGYAVEIATDGASGLARIAEGGIDLIALDHYMPNQDGLEILASIRNLAEPPPVIYITATLDGSIAVEALKAGAIDYVAKDVSAGFLPLLKKSIELNLNTAMLHRAKDSAEAKNKRYSHLIQSIVDTIRDPLVVLDQDMTIVTGSKAFLTMFGIAEAEAYGRRVFELGQHQWDVPALRDLMVRVVPENKPIESFEIEDNFPNLGYRVFNLNARKISDPENYAERILLVFEDITDRRQRERDAAVLTNEISHRIRNNLQIVVGLLTCEIGSVPQPYAQGYKAMQSRVGAISALYDLLSQSNGVGTVAMAAYLKGIAKAMSASLLGNASGITIEVRAESLDIDHVRAVPFGLLVNELATNAIMHAFPGGRGRVVVSVEQVGDQIELVVAHDGVDIKNEDSAKGLKQRGTNYVDVFVRQLDGTIIAPDSGRSGTTVRIRFPLLLDSPQHLEPLAA